MTRTVVLLASSSMLLEDVAEFEVLAKHDLFLIRLTGPYALFVRQSEWPEVHMNSRLCLSGVFASLLHAAGGAAHQRVRLLSPGVCLGLEGKVSVCHDCLETDGAQTLSVNLCTCCRIFLFRSFASGSVKKWTRPP